MRQGLWAIGLLPWLAACQPPTDVPWALRGDTRADAVRFRVFGDGDWRLRDDAGTVLAPRRSGHGLLDFAGLRPGGHYQLLRNREPVAAPFLTPRPGTVPVLFAGSCLNRGLLGVDGTILDSLRRQLATAPAARMLWLGDTLYLRDSDLDTADSLQAAWDRQFATPALRTLLGAVASDAIWDDHDFGPNDADRTLPQAGASHAAFQAHWANPDAVWPDRHLLTHRFRQGPVEVFMLDDRSERAPLNGTRQGSQQFGRSQLDWLKAALLASDAPFRLVVSGGQFWTDDAWEEGWQHYRDERNDFIRWLEAHPLPGLFFVSGDRHHSTLFRRRFASGLVLHELTCSALTSAPEEAAEPGYAAVERLFTVTENNFCRLDFDPARGQIRVQVFARNGARLANADARLR